MKKVVDVVTIEAKEKVQNCLVLDNIYKFMYSIGGGYLTQSYLKDACKTAYHVYFLSDEDIKEGDWFIRNNEIHQCYKSHKTDIEFKTDINSVYCGVNTFWDKKFCKKIIVATDPSLVIEETYEVRSGKNVEYCMTEYNLPQPSIEFLTQFAVNYNSKTPITQVMVEYEDLWIQDYALTPTSSLPPLVNLGYKLKINPIDNTVITSIIKNNYSKAEVIEIYKQGARDYCSSSQSIESFLSKIGDGTKWIEKNL